MKKIIPALVVTLWMGTIMAVFFVVQRPDFLQVLAGIKNLFLIVLIPCLMATLAACMGVLLLPDANPLERLILGAAIGMGIFGLMGFGLAVFGLAKPFILWTMLLALTGYFAYAGKLSRVGEDARRVAEEIHASAKSVAPWIPISVCAAFGLAFLMSLVPPADDFDALFYHLTVPAWWLRDGGLTRVALPHYWYPQMVEGSFVWALALGVDTAAHLIHLFWFLLSALLLWHWARQLWGGAIAWDALLILLTMPSLLWLASWAYTDYALTFTGIGTLYSLWKWKNSGDTRWLLIGGVMAGMALSVKYTGFVIPLTGAVLVISWEREILPRFKNTFYFSGIALLVASPWYIRNWVWMENPIYPFVFGGPFWDTFLAQAYAAAGTGIGFDLGQLLILPLTATLGTRDMNFFDGRIGPFLLILFPLAVYAAWKIQREEKEARRALLAIGLFALIGAAAWTSGVISSAHLFQTRLLFPALLPMSIPLALGLNAVYKLDTPRFKISYIVRSMLALTVLINLLNFGLQTLVRNPLAAAIGTISRQQYLENRQPGYAGALILMKKAPDDARVYFLFEPRSYGMKARVQPDAINANFAHDLWLYGTSEKIVAAWRQQGYTHVLLSKTGADFMFHNEPTLAPNAESALEQTEKLLTRIGESRGGYVLYEIP
jgi:4-amino-4-deoxy-L-arabinose transferase-like glycosyltransferase